MRDQVSASGAGARFRALRDATFTRITASTANAGDQALGATVIAPDPVLWRRRSRALEAAPVGGGLKRVFDVTVAAAAIVLLAPLLALIWMAVRFERGGGDAIFRQERGGLGGLPFAIYKFRTMICAENGVDVQQVRAGDARITQLGHFLRRTSWDELPQLFNVLRGDMSLIGPRPHALAHDGQFAEIEPSYSLRFRAPSGITGLAQVSGCRAPTETDEKVKARTGVERALRHALVVPGQHQISAAEP